MNNNFISEIEKAEPGPWRALMEKMEQVFLELGFGIREIDGTRYFVYCNNFCKITPLKYPNGTVKFVLEWTDNEENARKHMLEDGDLYATDLPETELLQQLRSDLMREQRISQYDSRGK